MFADGRRQRDEVLLWDDARHRKVVRVADPADGVGVVDMAVGELGRAPAVDRAPDELFRADEERETDEDDDGVLATQSVHVVVVDVELELADAQHRLEQAIHARRRRVTSRAPAKHTHASS